MRFSISASLKSDLDSWQRVRKSLRVSLPFCWRERTLSLATTKVFVGLQLFLELLQHSSRIYLFTGSQNHELYCLRSASMMARSMYEIGFLLVIFLVVKCCWHFCLKSANAVDSLGDPPSIGGNSFTQEQEQLISVYFAARDVCTFVYHTHHIRTEAYCCHVWKKLSRTYDLLSRTYDLLCRTYDL